MIPKLKSEGYTRDGIRLYHMGGGGGGQAQPTQSSVYQTNIPEYAQPYVEQMLGSAQQQVFNYQPDASGNMVNQGIKPYTPFSNNASDYFAGFSPLQQQAQQGASNMQTAGQLNQASGLAGAAGMMGLGTQYNPANYGTQSFGQQVGGYMSPYMQSVVENQQRDAQRQADIATTGRNAQATQAGAFGGARQFITDAEAARNLALQKGDIQAQGSQNAFNQAQNQYNTTNALNEQSRQYGAGLGMQGLQTALQGAGQLGQLGQDIYGQQMGINQLQNQYGQQQQQQQQNILNQQIQNYATAQQYPMMQLGNLSNLLRGLPMQSTTVQSYQAPPSLISQAAGLGTAGIGALGLYNTMNKTS